MAPRAHPTKSALGSVYMSYNAGETTLVLSHTES